MTSEMTREKLDSVIRKVKVLLAPDTKRSDEHLRDKAERLVNLADKLRERVVAKSIEEGVEILAIALASVGADDRTHAAVAEVAADEMDIRATSDLISLVMDPAPSIDQIRTWSEDDIKAVDKWASCIHLSASDNDVEVPQKPQVIRTWERSVS